MVRLGLTIALLFFRLYKRYQVRICQVLRSFQNGDVFSP